MAPVEFGIRCLRFSDGAWGIHLTLRLIGHLGRVESLLAYPTLLLFMHSFISPGIFSALYLESVHLSVEEVCGRHSNHRRCSEPLLLVTVLLPSPCWQ